MKTDLIKQFNLPNYIKGKSFAEASKAIMDKFKDREDKTSKETMAVLLGRLKDAQELVRAQEKPYPGDQAIVEGAEAFAQSNQFFLGGASNQQNNYAHANLQNSSEKQTEQTMEGVKDGVASAIPIAGLFRGVEKAGKGLGQSLGGNEGGDMAQGFLDPFSNVTRSDTSAGEKTLSVMDPIASGIITMKKNKERREKASTINDMRTANAARMEYAMGGKLSQNKYFLGGLFGKKNAAANTNASGSASGAKGGPGAGAYLQAAQSAFSFGQEAFGKKSYDQDNLPASSGGAGTAAVSGAMQGAQAGMAFGPWGAAIGGIVGAGASLLGNKKRKKAIETARRRKDQKVVNAKVIADTYAYGGNMKKKTNAYAAGGDIDPNAFMKLAENLKKMKAKVPKMTGSTKDIHPEGTRSHKLSQHDPSDYVIGDANLDGFNDEEQAKFADKPKSSEKAKKEKSGKGKKIGDFAKKAGTDLLRYSPAIMNAIQYMSAKAPHRETLAKMDNRYRKQFVDERAMINAINESFNPDAASEAAGGSLSRLATLQRANQLAKTKAVGDAYLKAEDLNKGEERTAQQFDANIDRFNVGVRHKEAENYARDLGAFNTERSKMLGAIGENLGDLGTEISRGERIKEMFDYDRYGRYISNKKAKGGKLDDVFDYIRESYLGRFKK